jgi:parallel beta-helix repeat protein
MNPMRRTITAAATIAILTGAAIVAAGPLDPPAGPVAPTMKTLSDVEPRVALTQETAPGDATNIFKVGQTGASYYLTSNIYVAPGKNAILITTWPVTIDLNGFSIIGLNGSLEGITSGGQYRGNITIKNGTISGMGGNGISLGACFATHVQNVGVSFMNGFGIDVGNGALVTDCTAFNNAAPAFHSTGNTTFQRCTANTCQIGFSGVGKDTVEGCTAAESSQAGFYLGSQSTIRNCQANYNTLQGIVCTDSCTMSGNQCRANGSSSASIWAMGNGNRIEDNTTHESAYGVYLSGNNNTVARNTFTSPSQRAVYAGGTKNLIIQNTMYNTIGGILAVAFNNVGAILTPAFNPQAISGTTGGGLQITDPYANIIIN